MRNVCFLVLMDKYTVLCNEYHHECMHMSADGLIMEVCVQLTSMVDFDWLGEVPS